MKWSRANSYGLKLCLTIYIEISNGFKRPFWISIPEDVFWQCLQFGWVHVPFRIRDLLANWSHAVNTSEAWTGWCMHSFLSWFTCPFCFCFGSFLSGVPGASLLLSCSSFPHHRTSTRALSLPSDQPLPDLQHSSQSTILSPCLSSGHASFALARQACSQQRTTGSACPP